MASITLTSTVSTAPVPSRASTSAEMPMSSSRSRKEIRQVRELMREAGYAEDKIKNFSKRELLSYASFLSKHDCDALLEHLLLQPSSIKSEEMARAIMYRISESRVATALYRKACEAPVCFADQNPAWSLKFVAPTTSSGFAAQTHHKVRAIELSQAVFEKTALESLVMDALDAAFSYTLLELINATRTVYFYALEQEARAQARAIAALADPKEREERIKKACEELAQRAEYYEFEGFGEHHKIIRAGIAEGQMTEAMDYHERSALLSFEEHWREIESDAHTQYWKRSYKEIMEKENPALVAPSLQGREPAEKKDALSTSTGGE